MAAANIQKPKIKKPSKEGYLEKQSSFWKTYRKRWMVLQGHMLYSFKEEKEYENPTEIFDLRIYNKAKKSSDGKTGQFELASPNDSRIFLASSEQEMKDWIKHIKSASNAAKNSNKSASNSKAPAKQNKSNVPSSKKRNSTSSSKKKRASNSNISASAKKTAGSRSPTKKKAKPAPSSSASKSRAPQKSLKVTNSSMDKHIARMQKSGGKKSKHSKSKSHHTDITPPTLRATKSGGDDFHKKKKKNDTGHAQRASVPNLLAPKKAGHSKAKSHLVADASMKNQLQHRRSVSSMFGGKNKGKGLDLRNSQTETVSVVSALSASTDEEDNVPQQIQMQSSQSQRNIFGQSMQRGDGSHTPTFNRSYDAGLYAVTFTAKPFGLTLNPFDEDNQIGAVVMVNHNVNEQHISQGSQFIAINGESCRDYKFERIKNMCRNAQLPTTIQFVHAQQTFHYAVPGQSTLNVAVDTVNGLQPQTQPQPRRQSRSYSRRSNEPSPRSSPRFSGKNNSNNDKKSKNENSSSTEKEKPKEKEKEKEKAKKKKKTANAKPKESLKAKQNREKKSAKQLMESLGGMNDIKEAEKCQRLKKWKECVQCYERGIGDLEKSLKALQAANILSEFQQKQCQSQIDEYCRTLITIQREHKSEINAAKNAQKRASGNLLKKTKTEHSRAKSTQLGKKKNMSSYKDENVNEDDEAAVFGTSKAGKKRESAVALKKKEMARMKREMETGKVENPNGSDDENEDNNKKSKDNDDKPEDIYSFLDRTESEKKHKDKMSGNNAKKKNTKKKKTTKKTDDKKKGKKKKGKKDEEDDEKEDDDKKGKKKTGVNKQDDEFRTRLEADIISEAPDVCFKDVQGLANVKLALYETIILPAMRPELFTGLRTPTGGLLLFGPPGNGKTMIAKCVAAECEATFFSISASSITSKFVGDAERIMRTLFNLAREKAPSIIFIDEIDSMLTARGGKNEAESSRRIKTEFLIQFDGVKKASDSAKRILVIGATNLPDQLDEAVLRRFGKRIMVPLPDPETRSGLLRLLMSKQKADLSEEDYQEIITKTDGYSCSDLSTLCKDAAMGPIRSLGARILEIKNMADMPPIKKTHFDGALDNVRPSLTTESLKFFDDWNDKYGSKIHLSMSALPESMRPYTMEELAEIARKRAEAEEKEKAAAEEDEAESSSGEYEDDSEEESDD